MSLGRLILFVGILFSSSVSWSFLCPSAGKSAAKGPGCRAELSYHGVSSTLNFTGPNQETGALGASSHSGFGLKAAISRKSGAYFLNYQSNSGTLTLPESGDQINPSPSISSSLIELGYRRGDGKRFTWGIGAGSFGMTTVSEIGLTSVTLQQSSALSFRGMLGLGLFSIKKMGVTSEVAFQVLSGASSGSGYSVLLNGNLPLKKVVFGIYGGIESQTFSGTVASTSSQQKVGLKLAF